MQRIGTTLIACALAWLSLSTAAFAQTQAPVHSDASAPASKGIGVDAPSPAVVGSMPMHVDATGRMQADVLLDGKGPLRFTIDTAANGIVLSQAATERLHLRAGAVKSVVGGIGHGDSRAVHVNTLRTAMFDVDDLSLAVLPGVAGDGILGMAPFLRGRVEFDFATHTIVASPSSPTPAGYAAATGELRDGLLLVDVTIDGVPAKALIDTGTPLNIGNPKLQAALGLVPGDTRLSPGGTFTDAFGQPRIVEQATAAKIAIGAVTFARPTLRFADMPVFRALGIDDGPALILGIEPLAHMGAIAIDFPHAQLQLRP